MFGALAEFERSLIRERTLAGLAAARREGRIGGRPAKMPASDIAAAEALLADPRLRVATIARRFGVSVPTFYRYVPAAQLKIGVRFARQRRTSPPETSEGWPIRRLTTTGGSTLDEIRIATESSVEI
jgi:DNA invertase Pin-like site-specific DNA recombinase